MYLKTLSLQNFRNYTKSAFTFDRNTTVIIGANAIGKTNLIESLFVLATGKSNRSEKEKQLITFGESVCRITGIAETEEDTEETLEVILSEAQGQLLRKKYLVNGVAKRRVDFAGRITAVLFTPTDIELVDGQPSMRRKFLDEVLEQVDYEYRVSYTTYYKALRQRNALLNQVQETGIRNDKLFAYWDQLLILHGQKITQKREALISYINHLEKNLFPFTLSYDKSLISEERLLQYKQAEVGAGVTLVGPHRDDVIMQAYHPLSKDLENVKYFSSRGQQRLVVFELKLAQISYLKSQSERKPLLLLDDIFSELDNTNIAHILHAMHDAQTIITTTHREFVENVGLEKMKMIELKK